MVLREDLRYIIVSNKLQLVELREDSFSKGLLYGFKVYLRKPGEDAVLPVSVSEESFDRARAEVRGGAGDSSVPHRQFAR